MGFFASYILKKMKKIKHFGVKIFDFECFQRYLGIFLKNPTKFEKYWNKYLSYENNRKIKNLIARKLIFF